MTLGLYRNSRARSQNLSPIKSRQHGYSTLLIMIFILMMIAITAKLSYPAISAMIHNYRVTLELELFCSTVRNAYLFAIQHQTNTIIEINSTSYAFRRLYPTNSVLIYRKLPDKIFFNQITPKGLSIKFSPKGALSPISIYIRGEQKECKASIALRGRVRKQCWEI